MLVQTVKAGPLLHDARPGGRHLLLDPHLQHLLLLHALLLHGARLQPPPQSPVQEAGSAALQRLSRPRGAAHFGELQDSGAQAAHGVDVLQAPGDSGFVSMQELQAEGGQVLQGLLSGWEVTPGQTLVSLKRQSTPISTECSECLKRL